MQAGGFVFGGGEEVGPVEGELEVGYGHGVFVCGGVVEAFACLEVQGLLVWVVEGERKVSGDGSLGRGTFASYWLMLPSSCPAIM